MLSGATQRSMRCLSVRQKLPCPERRAWTAGLGTPSCGCVRCSLLRLLDLGKARPPGHPTSRPSNLVAIQPGPPAGAPAHLAPALHAQHLVKVEVVAALCREGAGGQGQVHPPSGDCFPGRPRNWARHASARTGAGAYRMPAGCFKPEPGGNGHARLAYTLRRAGLGDVERLGLEKSNAEGPLEAYLES